MVDRTADKKNDEESRDQVIRALEYYANPDFWEPMYGGEKVQDRLWVGPGPGYLLAQQALDGIEDGEK